MKDPIIPFHQHLNVCRQCRERPMQLCPEGARLLREAALGPFVISLGVGSSNNGLERLA